MAVVAFACRPGVMARELDGETVLLDTISGFYFRLNETGSLVWRCLANAASIDDVAAELVKAADVDTEVARQDVAELLTELEHRGLITVGP